MTTQMDVSSQNTVVQESGMKQKINWMVTVNAGLMVVLIMGILVTLRPFGATNGGAVPVAEGDTSLQPAFQADAARYSALAEFYTAQDEVSSSSFLATNPELSAAQRYIATKEQTTNQRAIEANAARYNGMAEFYTTQDEASGSSFLATNPELSVTQRFAAKDRISNQRAIEASAARYSGMAEFYTTKNESPSTFLAANPELSTFQRYTAVNKVTQSDILATNPELSAVRRYVAHEDMINQRSHNAGDAPYNSVVTYYTLGNE